jgi:hypothetical protein
MSNNLLQERSIYFWKSIPYTPMLNYYICFLKQYPEKCKEYIGLRLFWIEPWNMSTRGYLCGVSMCPILYSSFLIPITFLPCTQSCSLWDKIYKKIKKHSNIDWNMNEAKHSKCVNVCRTKAYTVSSLRGKETFLVSNTITFHKLQSIQRGSFIEKIQVLVYSIFDLLESILILFYFFLP